MQVKNYLCHLKESQTLDKENGNVGSMFLTSKLLLICCVIPKFQLEIKINFSPKACFRFSTLITQSLKSKTWQLSERRIRLLSIQVMWYKNGPIISVLTDFTQGLWKEFDVDFSLIGPKEMIGINYWVTRRYWTLYLEGPQVKAKCIILC